MSDRFGYVYNLERDGDRWSSSEIAETVLGGLAMMLALVLVMIAWLCM